MLGSRRKLDRRLSALALHQHALRDFSIADRFLLSHRDHGPLVTKALVIRFSLYSPSGTEYQHAVARISSLNRPPPELARSTRVATSRSRQATSSASFLLVGWGVFAGVASASPAHAVAAAINMQSWINKYKLMLDKFARSLSSN